MRIRKHARLFVEDSSSPKRTSFLVCKLNRSPWDDESFFSQLVEEGWDINLPLNGSLAHSNLISDSNPSGDSMELSFEYIEEKEPSPPLMAVAKLGEEEGQIDEVTEAKTTSSCVSGHLIKYLCPRVDEKAVNHPQQPPPAPAVPPPPVKKRGRPKKPAQAAAGGGGSGGGSNPHSYYYYSGFGPSWSKRRGNIENNNNIKSIKKINNVTNKKRKKNDSSVVGYDKNEGDNCNIARRSSSTSRILSEVDDGDENDNDNDQLGEDGNNNKISVVETVYDEQLDYIDDEFDDEDEDEEENGGVRARPRKPIKARSLKSLM